MAEQCFELNHRLKCVFRHIFDVVALRSREACVAQQTLRGLTGTSLEASPLVVLSIPIRTSVWLMSQRAAGLIKPLDHGNGLDAWGACKKATVLLLHLMCREKGGLGTVAHRAQRLDEQAGGRVVLLCVRIK
jgi:hypothetical protein